MKTHLLCAAVSLFAVGFCSGAPAKAKVEPQCAERVREIAGWLRPEAGFAETRVANRAVWDAQAEKTPGVMKHADDLLKESLVVPDDAQYENIYPWARPLRKEVDRLLVLTSAECLQNRGRYLPRIVQTLDMLSAMRTWVNPYHDRPSFGSFKGKYRLLELGNGIDSQAIALTLDLLRDVLPADCRARALAALRRQTLDVYLEIARDGTAAARNHCGFYDNRFNWCAACNEYFTSAAILVLDDPLERATAIELAERSTKAYLSGFTADGVSLEGASYWNYGFGQYLRLGLQIRRATGGRDAFFPEPRALACARSGFDVFYNDVGAPAYGDCGSDVNCETTWYLVGMVWPELATERAAAKVERSAGDLLLTTFRLFPTGGVQAPANPKPYVYPIRTWYPDGLQQLVCRPHPAGPADARGLYASFKGGGNDAGHNHNDVGVYGIAIGGRQIMGDPGNKAYDLDTFGPKRYDCNLRNSYGHPVPLVDGRMQRTGAYGARLVGTSFSDEKDAVELDLRDVYDLPGLKTLTRSLTYCRNEERVVVRDTVSFDGTGTYETPIVTYGTVKEIGAGVFQVTSADGKDSLVCQVRAVGGALTTREELLDEPAPGKRRSRRFALAFAEPVSEATLEVTWEKASERAGR